MSMPVAKYQKARYFSQRNGQYLFLFLIGLGFAFARLRTTNSEVALFQYGKGLEVTARISRISSAETGPGCNFAAKSGVLSGQGGDLAMLMAEKGFEQFKVSHPEVKSNAS